MRKESLQKLLKTNLMFSGIVFVVMAILFAYKLYMIQFATPNLYDIQTNLLFKDYIVILLFITSLINLIASIYFYFDLTNRSPKQQVFFLIVNGFLLLPFSLLTLIIGNMIMIERPKTKSTGFYVSVFTMVIFVTVYSLLLVGFAENKAIYTQSKTYEFEYRVGDEVILFDMEVVYKEDQLLFVNLDTDTSMRDPQEIYPDATQMSYHLSVNTRITCYLFSSTSAVTNQTESCQMTPESHPNITLNSLLDFDNFTLTVGTYTDAIGVLPAEGVLTLINESEKDNYYD